MTRPSSLRLARRSLAALPLLASLAAPLVVTTRAEAQGAPAGVTTGLGYGDYLARVGAANLDLIAERAGVDQADARIDVARVFPSPRLSGGVSMVDVSQTSAPTMTLVQLDVPLDLSDRVGRRTDLAAADAATAHAELDALAWQVRAEAGRAWVDALHAQLVLERTQRTLASLERLVEVNRRRLDAGSAGEVQLLQSRVESERYRGRVLAAEADLHAARLVLARWMGQPTGSEPVATSGSLDVHPTGSPLSLDLLLETARAQRADLRAAELGRDSAHRARSLASANRMLDVSLSVNWQHSFPSIGTPFNTPDYDTLGLLASVELPVRLFWHGDLDEADARLREHDARVAAVELAVDVEVRSALARYEAARARLELYRGTILQDADRVFEAALYTYERGGGSLLEVLVAQRTVDEVYLDYFDALAEHAALLVELERVTGQERVRF